MRRFFFTLLLLAACNQTPIETPVRSFDRPSDVALTCAIFDPRAGQGGRYIPLALSDCGPLPLSQVQFRCAIGYENCNPAVDGTTVFFTPQLRALVANSARGEVALVDVPNAVLWDLDRQNPGFNFVPVGRLPEAIRATGDGCMAITANTDSCDLAQLDLSTLYNMSFAINQPNETRAFGANVVHRVELWTPGERGKKSRRLEARPTQIEVTPLTEHPGTDLSCGGAVYHAWVALPGCEAVVEAELAPSTVADPLRAHITRAIHVGRDGAQIIDPDTLDCPAECTGGDTPDDPSAAPSMSGGRLPDSQAAPGVLTIDNEGATQRLVIGDYYGENLYVVPLDATTGEPSAPRTITLEAGALGVLRARVSPRTLAGKFLYAVARDGTVRVVDLDRELECETNPDPSEFQSVPDVDPAPGARRLGCLPLGERATPRRSAFVVGPGIKLPGNAMARDVAFVHLDTPEIIDPTTPPFEAQPQLLVGDFAWIAGSDGHATVVQIYDACPQPNAPVQLEDGSYTPACALGNSSNPIAQNQAQQTRLTYYVENFGQPYPIELERLSHRVRNGERRFQPPNNVGDSLGTPRFDDPANPLTITVDGSPAKVGAGFRAPTLEVVNRFIPGITPAEVPQGYPTNLQATDPYQIRGESWTLGWEGVIAGSARNYGEVCGAGDPDCPRASLLDAGATICSRGVQIDDKVELLGCESDVDCVYTQVCAHDPAASAEITSGLCLDRDDRSDSGDPIVEQLTQCSPLLRAQRRFRVTSAKQDLTLPSGRVADVLSLSEIYEPEFRAQTHACVIDADCMDVTIPAPDNQIVQRAALRTKCLLDADGARRCLRACDPLPACSDGLDNDGDGVIDADDADCKNANGEYDPNGAAEGTTDGVNGGPNTDDAVCGKGYLCAETSTSTTSQRDYRCMRAPLDVALLTACFKKPQRYQLRVGGGWSVSGSSNGFLTDLEPDATTRECGPPPISSEFTRLRNPRIPLDAPLCPQQIDPALGVDALTWAGAGAPNACQFVSNDDDKLIHFENPFMAIALRMPKNPTGYIPDDDTLVKFTVVGGGFALGTQLGISGQLNAQSPRVMVTAPDGQTVFVIDEGKGSASTALRGQLLRMVSSVQACDPAFQVR